ncbi:HD family hydrolase [uncultured Nostoc sp.]|uniref:HD domain-containing protein n=1 Tax=uncultured Nostoc sp. TaxID=340711 RepID=UPI0035CAD199
MQINRLTQQIQFIIEIDRLKQVIRQTLLTDGSRWENSAEHSWHLAVMAIVLAEYAPKGVDIFHAIKMLLIHDLVEIDAGDTFRSNDLRTNL